MSVTGCYTEDEPKIRPERDLNPRHEIRDTGAVFYQLSYQNLKSSQLPVDLIAQLVEHCIGIAEVLGSNPVTP